MEMLLLLSLSIICKILFSNLLDFYFAQSPMDIRETRVCVVSKSYILQLCSQTSTRYAEQCKCAFIPCLVLLMIIYQEANRTAERPDTWLGIAHLTYSFRNIQSGENDSAIG